MGSPKLKKLLFIIAIWLYSVGGYAQTKHAINGFVTDDKGKSIVGATVFFNEIGRAHV